MEIRSGTFSHRAREKMKRALGRAVAVLTVAAIALPASLGVLVPNEAGAEDFSSTMGFRTVKQAVANHPSLGYYDSSDGTVAYCGDQNLMGPSLAGAGFTTYYNGWSYVDGPLAAIVLNGYPNVRNIGGYQLSEEEARAATQIAIWTERGTINRDGDFDNWYPNGEHVSGNIYDFSSPAEKAAAQYLYDGAHNGTLTAPGNVVRMYKSIPNDYGHARQNMIYAPIAKGTLSLTKVSASPTVSEDNACYSLEGAVYGIYSDRDCAQEVARLTTDAAGKASSGQLVAGIYYVREIKASPGFQLDPRTYQVTVSPGLNTQVNGGSVQEVPLDDPTGLLVQKVDNETGEAVPAGAASLEGAEYTYWFFAGDHYERQDNGTVTDGDGTVIMNADGSFVGDRPDRTWVAKTNANGYTDLTANRIVAEKSDPLYTNAAGMETLPLGTVVVRETNPPEGYLISDAVFVMQIAEKDGQVTATGDISMVDGNRYIGDGAGHQGDQVKRGDIELVKVDGQTQERLAGVPFLITLNATSESHVAVTDTNGYLSTSADWIAHTSETNGNDAAVTRADDGSYTVDTDALDDERGIWFGASEPNDSLGALPYGTYTITELPVSANNGHNLVEFQITVSRDGHTVDAGTVDDNYLFLATTATSTDGDKALPTGETVELIDTVAYEGLVPGKSYTLEGTVMNKATGEPLEDAAGDPVTAEVKFTAKGVSGEQEVIFTIDTTKLSGSELVVFERLYDAKDELLEEHADLEDEAQTVTVGIPEIRTSATTEDGGKVLPFDRKSTLVDTVKYSGLNPGEKYVLEGTLMNKATGEPLMAPAPAGSYERLNAETGEWSPVDTESTEVELIETEWGNCWLMTQRSYNTSGEAVEDETWLPITDIRETETAPVTSRVEITAEAVAGTAEVAFTFDTTALAGTEIVAYETLSTSGGEIIAEHADLEDEAQTVAVEEPAIDTELTDKTDGDHEAIPSAETILTDTVRYEGLIPGRAYRLVGTLMVQSTGAPLIANDAEVTAEAEFVPNTPDGVAEVEFRFDSTAVPEGTNVVAFESLYYDDIEVATHIDIEDMDQTVEITETPDGSVVGQALPRTGGDAWTAAGAVAVAVVIAINASMFARSRDKA